MASKIGGGAALSAALLLLGGTAPMARAQTFPIGTWDLVISGSQRGVAQLTFASDNTITGTEIMTATIRNASSDTNPRGPFFSGTRSPFPENPNPTPVTNFYGRAFISGTWTVDSLGRTIGVFTESGGPDSLTNGVSFKAVGKDAVRMNLEAVRGGRHIHYRGIPLNSLADFSGDFYGLGSTSRQPFTELFTLTPAAAPNTYDVVGVGAAYNIMGWAYVSAKKQMAFVTLSDQTTNGILRSLAGPFSLTKGVGSLRGVISDGSGGEFNTGLKVTKQ